MIHCETKKIYVLITNILSFMSKIKLNNTYQKEENMEEKIYCDLLKYIPWY